MATIEYSSTSHIEVKPTIVEMTFSIRVSDDSPNKSITKFNDCVTKLKKRIMKKKSYREDTYKQQNIDFRKNDIYEYYYKEITTGKTISTDDYSRLDKESQTTYQYYKRFVGTYYITSSSVSIILNNTESVIKDFTDLINFSIDLNTEITAETENIYVKTHCTYNHTILKEEREAYMKQLYIDCINKGIDDLKNIAKNVSIFDPNNLKVNIITERSFDSLDRTSRDLIADFDSEATMRCGSASQTEQYFIPELIKELFNNNITLSRFVNLRAEI